MESWIYNQRCSVSKTGCWFEWSNLYLYSRTFKYKSKFIWKYGSYPFPPLLNIFFEGICLHASSINHYGRLLLCRVPKHTAKHTAKPYMHTAKALPCDAHGKEHTTFRRRQRRRLPCAIYRAHGKAFAVCQSWPTAKKQKTWEVTWRPPLPCACRRGTRQSSNVCRVPWLWHTVNIGFFAVCHGFCTRQRSLILYFFCLLRIWYPRKSYIS